MGSPIIGLRSRAGEPVCERCEIAATPVRRMRGLLGRAALGPGEGVLLKPAGSVHTWFMRFSIDVVFLDRDMRVLKVAANVAPWRARSCRGAKSALELRAGESERRGIELGERLAVVPTVV
ncbi:MAG: DUF192 domain-containing protein [Gaiellaceae bacterium]